MGETRVFGDLDSGPKLCQPLNGHLPSFRRFFAKILERLRNLKCFLEHPGRRKSGRYEWVARYVFFEDEPRLGEVEIENVKTSSWSIWWVRTSGLSPIDPSTSFPKHIQAWLNDSEKWWDFWKISKLGCFAGNSRGHEKWNPSSLEVSNFLERQVSYFFRQLYP